VRQEDKEIDGPALERDATLRESELSESIDEEELPEIASEVQRDPALEHRSQLLGAMRMILARETLVVTQLRLPQREERALQALQAAVSGKSTAFDQFVFADDRRDMLEQALAVLQANLTRGDDKAVAELHAKFGDLVAQVASLRHELKELGDSQDELLEANQKAGMTEASETDDKPKPPAVDPAAPKPASRPAAPQPSTPVGPDGTTPSTLTGPELPAAPAQPSTLTGPEPPPSPPPPTTLARPDLPPQPAWSSTLGVPDDPARRPRSDTREPPPAPSALSGPELPAEPVVESSVWDADTPLPPPPIERAQELRSKEEAKQDGPAKKPWWRRPFG